MFLDAKLSWNLPDPSQQPTLAWNRTNEQNYYGLEQSKAYGEGKIFVSTTDNHLLAQKIFGEDLPSIMLYLRLKIAATRPEVKNFIMDPTSNSEFWNVENFDLEK